MAESDTDLVLKAGEWVTCESGHRVCRSKADQTRDGQVRTEYFDKWHVDEPKPGDRLTKCWCGSLYIRTADCPGIVKIHREHRGWS